MLADDAASADGKVYIHGGTLDLLLMPTFPGEVARLAFVFTVEIEPTELQHPLTLSLEIVDADNNVFGDHRARAEFQAGIAPYASPGSSAYFTQVWRLERLRFENPGSYYFRILGDNQAVLASIPLHVAAIPGGVTARKF